MVARELLGVIESGDKCRYRRRGDLVHMALGDAVVTAVREHPALYDQWEVEGRDGYRTWVKAEDLYVIRKPR